MPCRFAEAASCLCRTGVKFASWAMELLLWLGMFWKKDDFSVDRTDVKVCMKVSRGDIAWDVQDQSEDCFLNDL
ncbi:hypothetical protein TNCT_548531 [Trichonephila clavata]|uniref:Uncharacterized protein n=1 Tax=Trichonephila clavata TaxID=2740835 RepID=A0A8X6LYK3_TRICU|nr:hypothetical protein TNCT_548531 [Trichonephila clavata]